MGVSGAFLPRWLSKGVRSSEPSPGWQGPLVLGWTGMRGVISLAAALSVPLLANGQDFPQRNLMLFITFMVILVTLVFQGLTLPLFIRFTKVDELEDPIPAEEQEASVRLQMRQAAVAHLQSQYAAELKENELVMNLHKRMQTEVALTTNTLNSLESDSAQRASLHQFTVYCSTCWARSAKCWKACVAAMPLKMKCCASRKRSSIWTRSKSSTSSGSGALALAAKAAPAPFAA